MEKNKTGGYLKYAIGEILLVVIGILIALQINNWNEDRKLDIIRQDYYHQLLEDLKKDKQFAEITVQNFNKDISAYETYKKEFSNIELTPIQVYNNLKKLNIPSTGIIFNSSAMESLINSGEINMIPTIIRNKLIDLKRKQEGTKNSAKINNDGKANLVINLSLIIGDPSLIERIEHQPKLKEFLNFEGDLKKLILTMEAIQGWKFFSQKTTIRRLNEMEKEMDIIIELIDKELK
jgi:hypothetical protein